MSGELGAALVAGFIVGGVAGCLSTEVLVARQLRADRDRWQRRAADAVEVLAVFVPPRARGSHIPSGWTVWRWRCDWHHLLGGCFGDPDAGPAEVHDEARRHFTDRHLTPDTFAQARRAVDDSHGWFP